MAPLPLFTLEELTRAFELVFQDPATAAGLAREWFPRFADETDGEGRLLHPDYDGVPISTLVIRKGNLSPAELEAHERRYFSGWSDERKREFLMGFSDLHVALVALVSPAAFERLRVARGISMEAAERSRQQMLRWTAALRDSSAAT